MSPHVDAAADDETTQIFPLSRLHEKVDAAVKVAQQASHGPPLARC